MHRVDIMAVRCKLLYNTATLKLSSSFWVGEQMLICRVENLSARCKLPYRKVGVEGNYW